MESSIKVKAIPVAENKDVLSVYAQYATSKKPTQGNQGRIWINPNALTFKA